MFKYENEKRPASSSSCGSRASQSTQWGQSCRSSRLPEHYVRRPLPPRPDQPKIPGVPAKSSVPLKVWVIASASCFAVCGILVLATIAITRWGSVTYNTYERPEPIYTETYSKHKLIKPFTTTTATPEIGTENIDMQVIGHLSRFKNIVGTREKKKNNENQNTGTTLLSKSQIHPIQDSFISHVERNIEKKDLAHNKVFNEIGETIPNFRPTLPDISLTKRKPESIGEYRDIEQNYPDYYTDDNLYNDYIESTSMTSYLLEKIQELHNWITNDPDFVYSAKHNTTQDFTEVLKALNESLIERNAGVLINKLKDIYFGHNFTSVNHSRKIILTNSTDLISFGILTLDVMLLHNIQMMAWENQESAKVRMLKDPNIYAFNSLFMDTKKVSAKENDVTLVHEKPTLTRRTNRIESVDDFDFGKNLLENILEIGLSTARAAIHLGRAYKNTKAVLNTLSNRDVNSRHTVRNIEENAHALNRLQASFDNSHSVTNQTEGFHTDLDCIWLLYCRNLAATAKLNAPYGTMARINGIALRMLTGELATDKALNTMIFEALSGWTDLRCNEMFPRCSKVDAAAIVLESILQQGNKSANKKR